MDDPLNDTAKEIQDFLDELVRVSAGLLGNVSSETLIEYLNDSLESLPQERIRNLLNFAVIDLVALQKRITRNGDGSE